MKQIMPMLADSVSDSELSLYMESNAYVAEEKYDGSRYIMQVSESGIKLTSRRESVKGGLCEKSGNIPHITEQPDLKKLAGYVFDGEVVSQTRKFGDVVSVMGSKPERAVEYQQANGFVTYIVFDILYKDGKCVEELPFVQRRHILNQLFEKYDFGSHMKLAPQRTRGKMQFYRDIVKSGGEGIMLKNLGMTYQEDARPKRNWIKVKKVFSYDGIVIGGEEGQGKYKGTLGALLIGQYVDGELVEVAKCSGMTDEQRTEFWAKIKKGQRWVIEFTAQEKTKDKRYRHPQYGRDRNDKNFKECIF